MVLGDLSLWKLLNDLIRDPDPDLVNPASIDVRVGPEMLLEVASGDWRAVDLTAGPVHLQPGEFAQVPTLEWLMVPNGYAVEVTLEGSLCGPGVRAYGGVWLEPGWCGPGDHRDPQRDPLHPAPDRAGDAYRRDRRPPARPAGGPSLVVARAAARSSAAKVAPATGPGAPDDRDGDRCLSAQRAFEPDHYLDCRQPGWEIYEDRGLVRFERPPGSRHALVFVDADCAEVLQALRGSARSLDRAGSTRRGARRQAFVDVGRSSGRATLAA